jgi:tRNA(fMet)-specific endonuclease VapC
MKYLLDTNICIYIINSRPEKVLQRFRREQIGSVGISAASASELAFGVMKSGSEKNRKALEKFFAPLEIVPYDESVIWHYVVLRSELEKRGEPIGSLDTMIAAHALALNAILVTNNVREFRRVPELCYENRVE